MDEKTLVALIPAKEALERYEKARKEIIERNYENAVLKISNAIQEEICSGRNPIAATKIFEIEVHESIFDRLKDNLHELGYYAYNTREPVLDKDGFLHISCIVSAGRLCGEYLGLTFYSA